ncbi:hypothetical protein H4S03_001793 [Coemansia sp. S3946]|nr:hypothetical protein H4S03_001793 [Coemansia sp. S3946]
MNLRIFFVFFVFFFSYCCQANVQLAQIYPRPSAPPSLSGAASWIAWFADIQIAVKNHCGWQGQPPSRQTPIATRPAKEANARSNTGDLSSLAPLLHFAAGALSLAVIQIALSPDAPQTMDIGTGPDAPAVSVNAGISAPRTATSIVRSYEPEHGGYTGSIASEDLRWFARFRVEYNLDLLDKLSDSQLETVYSAYHALRDWHAGLQLDGDQRLALFRVCLIADKHRSRGEVATPTTLLTSMAFRNMDKDDVMDIIPRLVLEYYSEQ